MKTKLCLLALLLLFVAVFAGARQAQQPPQPPNDPVSDSLFPPELIMQNQAALNLTEDQKNFFKTEMRQAQVRFTEMQWHLQDEAEKMAALLKQEPINEEAALAQAEKLLSAERDIKRTQL